jgi:hypothetical protein
MEQRPYTGDVLQKIAGRSFIVSPIVPGIFGLLHPAEDRMHRVDVHFKGSRS